MPKLNIDGNAVDVPPGTTVLEAARSAGVTVPTLCHLSGCGAFASCMVCVVQDERSGRLIPSCAAPAQDGMSIVTGNETVLAARKSALELLLSEHVGDCEAPCRRACPANVNIPAMIRHLRSGNLREAIATVKQDLALPAVFGRVCSAPCEKACRRRALDAPVSVRLLKRFVADTDLFSSSPWSPPRGEPSGRRVAVVGSGPAGLTLAYRLLRNGHACTVFERERVAGGSLAGLDGDLLPQEVLVAEIDVIRRMGMELRLATCVGRDVAQADLERDFDAVVMAVGGEGSAPTPIHAVRAAGKIAARVERTLRGEAAEDGKRRFDSVLGRLEQGELAVFMREADSAPRIEPVGGERRGLIRDEAQRECGRCMRCDCREAESCRLREYADLYGADQRRYKGAGRGPVEKIDSHADVIYEPGKCIKCGLCVRITAQAGEETGLTFIGRGFTVRVGVPFDDSLAEALRRTAARCVQACPTGALAFK